MVDWLKLDPRVDTATSAACEGLMRKKVSRIRLRHISDASGQSLLGFITDCVAKGAKVHTDDWDGYNRVQKAGYIHRVTPIHGDPERALKYFPHVHLIASLIKRWLGATHQRNFQ